MSNANTRNNYNKIGHSSGDDEMEMLLNLSNNPQQIMGNDQITTITMDVNDAPSTSQQHLQRQQHLQQINRDNNTTRINMEANGVIPQPIRNVENPIVDDRQRLPNLFAMLREARHQLNRSQNLRAPHHSTSGDTNSVNTHSRSWRQNLYEVLSSPVSPRAHTQVLRAILTPSSANVRYDSLNPNVSFPENDQVHFMLNQQNASQSEGDLQSTSRRQPSNGLENQASSTLRLSRQNSRLTSEASLNENSTSEPQTPVVAISNDNSRRQSIALNSPTNDGRQLQRQASLFGSTIAPTVDVIDEADTNAVGEMIVKFVAYFMRYLPFIFIVFVKFIHDHLLGILDILILQGVVYQINKSLKDQIAKVNQKSYAVLVRDLTLVVFVVTYRLILSTSTLDIFGLLINPPGTTVTLDLFSTPNVDQNKEVSSDAPIYQLPNSEPKIYEILSDATKSSNTISVTKTLSLTTLLYYIAVNDLILKLLTQLFKIIVTMFPTKIIRYKYRARLYALIENISQFYRALVPIRQWLRYLFESYTGLEVISGILFSSFYMGAKIFELFELSSPLKKAITNFVRNMDYDRKPTKDELEAAGSVCPICHDSYSSPVILECNHIFCDECVNTWFKREQTCPMCRAKVSEDPSWQDGATTYFYQLC